VWRQDPGKAQEKFDELKTSLPKIDERDEIASKSFRAAEQDIRGVAFLDGPRGLVVLLTCGQGQCASDDAAVALAKQAYAKIESLWPITTTTPGGDE